MKATINNLRTLFHNYVSTFNKMQDAKQMYKNNEISIDELEDTEKDCEKKCITYWKQADAMACILLNKTEERMDITMYYIAMLIDDRYNTNLKALVK